MLKGAREKFSTKVFWLKTCMLRCVFVCMHLWLFIFWDKLCKMLHRRVILTFEIMALCKLWNRSFFFFFFNLFSVYTRAQANFMWFVPCGYRCFKDFSRKHVLYKKRKECSNHPRNNDKSRWQTAIIVAEPFCKRYRDI